MQNRQFISVRFSPVDARRYTYHNDQAPLAIGDHAKVIARGGRPVEVEVVEILKDPPAFETKAIIYPEPQGSLALSGEGE